MLKKAAKAALAFLLSPEARRYEIALGIGLYAAIKAAIS